MSNEVILLIAVIFIITLVVALIQSKKRNEKPEAGRSGSPSSSGSDISKEKRETEKTVVKAEDPGEKSKKESSAGLLYIPPEFVVSGKKSAGGSAGGMASGTDSLTGTGAESRTEIRGGPGEDTAKSESISGSTSGKDARSSGESPANGQSQKVDTAASDGNTVQIYTYRTGTKKWVCPYCELENPDWTNVCQVCGEIRVRRS